MSARDWLRRILRNEEWVAGELAAIKVMLHALAASIEETRP